LSFEIHHLPFEHPARRLFEMINEKWKMRSGKWKMIVE